MGAGRGGGGGAEGGSRRGPVNKSAGVGDLVGDVDQSGFVTEDDLAGLCELGQRHDAVGAERVGRRGRVQSSGLLLIR